MFFNNWQQWLKTLLFSNEKRHRRAAQTRRRVRPLLESLEDRTAPATVSILDNGSTGYSTEGTWAHKTAQGYLSDQEVSAKGSGADTATWKFTVPAGTYRVYATWTPASNLATNATFTVLGSGGRLSAPLNQELAPNDITPRGGVAWELIGDITITGTVLNVRLSDAANDSVAADAIRIERLSPALTIGVEPLEAGAVVYAPLAPATTSATSEGLLALRLFIKNTDTQQVHVNQLEVSFPGQSAVAARTYSLDITLGAGATMVWNFQKEKDIDDRIFLPSPAPSQICLKMSGDDYSEPRTLKFPLKAHVSPVSGGSYLFPAKAKDLRQGEAWYANSNHATGAQGSQLFGYDMGVVAYDSRSLTGLLPGTDGTNNADHRIWGKPIYAMAAGTVVEWVNIVPSNPNPLQWSTDEELAEKMKVQADELWGNDPATGVARFANGGSGNHLYVKHGDEVMLYAHFQTGSIPAALRKVGAKFAAGQLLGRAGNSGNSTAPHLHIHAIQGTKPETGPLRPLPFRNIHVVDQSAVALPDPSGPWVKVEDQALPRAASVIWPAATYPTWYPPGWAEVSKHGVADASFQTEFDRITQSGYRMVWVDGYDVNGPTFFNLIFRPADGKTWSARLGMTAAEYQDEFTLRTQQGYRLVNVDSYLSGGNPIFAGSVRYAAIFLKSSGPAWTAYHGLTAAEHQAKFNDLKAKGFRPVNISAVAPFGVRQYTALYQKLKVGSFISHDFMTNQEYQQYFDANTQSGRRLVYLNAYSFNGEPRFIAIWYKKATAGAAGHGMSSSEYQAEFVKQLAAGLLTRAVTGYEEGDIARFAAFWTK